LTLASVFTMARSLAAASLERCSWMNAVRCQDDHDRDDDSRAYPKEVRNRGETEQQGV